MGKQNVIGYQNSLPWHLPGDLKHFKKMTMGKPIVMGRKTFESIGKPLPGRQNIVLSRNSAWVAAGCEVRSSLSIVLKDFESVPEIMIIGGATLFEESLELADKMYLTMIDHDFEGDTFFPDWNQQAWQQTKIEKHWPDEANPYAYQFLEFVRL